MGEPLTENKRFEYHLSKRTYSDQVLQSVELKSSTSSGKARQIRFTVYRPHPHAIPGNSQKFCFSLSLSRGANYNTLDYRIFYD